MYSSQVRSTALRFDSLYILITFCDIFIVEVNNSPGTVEENSTAYISPVTYLINLCWDNDSPFFVVKDGVWFESLRHAYFMEGEIFLKLLEDSPLCPLRGSTTGRIV